MENEEELEVVIASVSKDELLEMVHSRDKLALLEVFEKVPAIDIAEAADDFSPSDLISIFRLVKSEYTAEFFDGLSQDTKENLIKAMTDKELVTLINALLNYKEGTAGALMTTEYLEFVATMSVADCLAEIRAKGRDAETIYTIFVRDKYREFVGTIDLDDLIFSKDNEKLEDVMDRDLVYCFTSTDQEEVGQMFRTL